jgi:flagellar basal body-associated protein FliL
MAGKKKAATEEGGKPKKDKKKLIIVVVALAAAWKFGLLPIGGSKNASGTTATTQMQPGDAVAVGDPIVVNLADADKDRYARVGIALVLPGTGSSTESTSTDGATTTRRSHTTAATTETTTAPASGTATTTATAAGSTPAASTTTTAAGHALGAAGGPNRPSLAAMPRGESSGPAAALEPKFPRLRAAAISIIRTYTAAQLLSQDGPTNLEADISDAAYEIYGHDDIYGVIVTELIVQ